MACRPRRKMAVADRAKQFSPFAALSGLEAALAKKEAELLTEEKKILSEETTASVNRVLCRLEEGMRVRLEYYDGRARRYLTIFGEVTVHDKLYGSLRIGECVVLYDEIAGIEILGWQ